MENRMESNVTQFVHSLLGRKLLHLCCEAEMMDFDFAPLTLHALGCTRIIQNEEILVTTLDYQSWDGVESIHNDEWFHVNWVSSELVGRTVLSVQISPWNDLRLTLEGGTVVECLIANGSPHYGEEQEQWVLFEHTKQLDRRFLTIYNKRIDFHTRSGDGT